MTLEENNTASSKLSAFIEKNRKTFLIALLAVIVAVAGFIVLEKIKSASTVKALEVIDEITFTLTDGSAALGDSELQARRDDALDNLAAYTSKSGPAGVRANMLCAELVYQQKQYDKAIGYWKAAAEKGKKAYTAPLSYYNIASSYEQLGNTDEALDYYKKAAETTDYVLKAHAQFSYGRLLETKENYSEAVAVYKKLNDDSPVVKWANLAKSRIIALETEGKVE